MIATDRAAALELAALVVQNAKYGMVNDERLVTVARALLAAEAERERLAALVNEVEHDVSVVEQHRRARESGGQHCGVGGRLASAPPSTLNYLTRLVRDMRAVIGKATTDTERHDG